MLDIVGAQNQFGIAQPSDGWDVRRGEQRFQNDDIKDLNAQDVLNGPLHVWDVKTTEMIALSGDDVADGIPDVEFSVCKNGLEEVSSR